MIFEGSSEYPKKNLKINILIYSNTRLCCCTFNGMGAIKPLSSNVCMHLHSDVVLWEEFQIFLNSTLSYFINFENEVFTVSRTLNNSQLLNFYGCNIISIIVIFVRLLCRTFYLISPVCLTTINKIIAMWKWKEIFYLLSFLRVKLRVNFMLRKCTQEKLIITLTFLLCNYFSVYYYNYFVIILFQVLSYTC